ncbi:MAG: POTRA domain-containing protein [Chitinophagaceae bacterium]
MRLTNCVLAIMRGRKYHILVIILLVCSQAISAQSGDPEKTPGAGLSSASSVFIVGDILINGNKKTKDHIILREMPFHRGSEYSLKDLVKDFETARRQLMNTALFNHVVVAAKNFSGDTVTVMVDVKERWYLFPLPYFKPVDRNLNQWLVERHASLSRVNFGGKLLYNNATGRNDKVRLWLIAGYTKQISASYDRLYIDRGLKWGLNTSVNIGKNREVNYNTIGDKQAFVKDENNYIRNFANASAELTYRKAIRTRHRFGIRYTMEEVSDTIVTLNPAYFKNGRNRIQFPGIYYSMSYVDLDYIPYPTKGYAAEVSIGKNGFNKTISLWHLSAKVTGSWQLWSPKTFINLNLYGGIKLPFKQPYFNQRFLGYGDVFMQGYEYYVVDGSAGGYLKTTVAHELLNFNIRVPPVRKGKEAQRIPIRVFGKVYGNTGYVYNPEPGENALSNKMLYSGGFGIDLLTLYDVTFKLEYTFNQLGQNGLFLHRKSIF